MAHYAPSQRVSRSAVLPTAEKKPRPGARHPTSRLQTSPTQEAQSPPSTCMPVPAPVPPAPGPSEKPRCPLGPLACTLEQAGVGHLTQGGALGSATVRALQAETSGLPASDLAEGRPRMPVPGDQQIWGAGVQCQPSHCLLALAHPCPVGIVGPAFPGWACRGLLGGGGGATRRLCTGPGLPAQAPRAREAPEPIPWVDMGKPTSSARRPSGTAPVDQHPDHWTWGG